MLLVIKGDLGQKPFCFIIWETLKPDFLKINCDKKKISVFFLGKLDVKFIFMDHYLKSRSCFQNSNLTVFKNILSKQTVACFSQFCKAVTKINETDGSRCGGGNIKHVSDKIALKVWVHWYTHWYTHCNK